MSSVFFLAKRQKPGSSAAANSQTASGAQTLEFSQVVEAPRRIVSRFLFGSEGSSSSLPSPFLGYLIS